MAAAAAPNSAAGGLCHIGAHPIGNKGDIHLYLKPKKVDVTFFNLDRHVWLPPSRFLSSETRQNASSHEHTVTIQQTYLFKKGDIHLYRIQKNVDVTFFGSVNSYNLWMS